MRKDCGSEAIAPKPPPFVITNGKKTINKNSMTKNWKTSVRISARKPPTAVYKITIIPPITVASVGSKPVSAPTKTPIASIWSARYKDQLTRLVIAPARRTLFEYLASKKSGRVYAFFSSPNSLIFGAKNFAKIRKYKKYEPAITKVASPAPEKATPAFPKIAPAPMKVERVVATRINLFVFLLFTQ